MTRAGYILIFWTGWNLFSGPAFAEENYLAMVTEYVEKIENIYDGNWAFTYTLDDKVELETRTVRRNTSLPFLQSETLLAVNGQPPSEERLQAYAERRQRAFRRRQTNNNRPVEDEEEGNEKDRFLAMLLPESIRAIKQEGELLYLGFKALEEGREEIYEKLQGVLILDTEAEYIKELQVRVMEPFSPFLLTKIEAAYFSLRFTLNEGVPRQSAASFSLQGRAFFIKELVEDREVTWTDIQSLNPHAI